MQRVAKLFGLGLGLLLAGLLAALAWRVLASVKEIAPPTTLAGAQLPPSQPAADDWPNWRGPASDGHAAQANPPTTWSATENVVWRVPVAGLGYSTPCVWGNRIFLSTADEESQVISLICFDRSRGEQLWTTVVHRGGFPRRHEKNSHASATPACDGTHVYVPFAVKGAIWVTALDLNGKIVWQTEAGPYVTIWGYGSSPVLYQSLVIVAGDNRGRKLGRILETSFLAALNRKDGRIVWRIRRPNENSFGTPIVAEVARRPQLLLAGAKVICAYDPATGRELWHCHWPAVRTAGTMAFHEDLVFASATSYDKDLVCIRADGSGDVTDSHVVWRTQKGAADVPSPLVDGDNLYVIDDQGIATCFEAATGKRVAQKRLGGKFFASPILAGGYLYATNEEGTTLVLRPGPKLETIAQNELGDPTLASPVPCGDRLYIRTNHFLWCLGLPR